MTEKQRETSARAKRVWARLAQWYGTRLADTYGEAMPTDWSRSVDRSTDSAVKQALDKIKVLSPIHPPTFPQWDQALRVRSVPRETTGPEPLEAWVARTAHAEMLRNDWPKWWFSQPWTYCHDPAGTIVAIVLAAHESAPSRRYALVDMQAAEGMHVIVS